MNALKELQERFNQAMVEAEKIRSAYEGKTETMTAEEEQRYDQFLNEADGLKTQIERMAKADSLDRWSKELPERMRHDGGRYVENMPDDVKRLEEMKRKAYSQYLRGISQRDDPIRYYENTKEYRDYLDAISKASPQVLAEIKAYQADNPAGGGFMVTPQVLASEILLKVKDFVFVRELSRTFEVVTAESLGVPAMDTEPSDTDWTAELGTGNEESTMEFGKRELRPYPLAKRIKLSKKLLRQVPDAEGVVIDRLAYKRALTEEKAFLTGDGNQKPLGIFTNDSDGISTDRETETAANNALTGDEVIDCFYKLKAPYRSRATWIMHRTTIARVRKLKDSSNSYLWQPGLIGATFVHQGTTLIGDQPDTLMGRPVRETEHAPEFAADTRIAVLGDFQRGYWIADALNMQIQVLYELYAATNQMGYILRSESDGMPVLPEAFSRLKVKA